MVVPTPGGKPADYPAETVKRWRRNGWSGLRRACYAITQIKRKRVEEIFGWMKTI